MFVRTKWELPSFQLGEHTISSVIPVRVSTWSSPPFIHRDQNEKMARYENGLSEFCSRQSGQWRYIGPPIVVKPPKPIDPTLARAIENAPATEQGIRDIIQAGNEALAIDLWRAFVEAVRDPLGKDAVDFAAKQKWLGRFECKRESDSWLAQVSVTDVKTRVDRNLIYKDMGMKVELNLAK